MNWTEIGITLLGLFAVPIVGYATTQLAKIAHTGFDLAKKYIENDAIDKAIEIAEEYVFEIIEQDAMPLALEFKKVAADGKITPAEEMQLHDKVFEVYKGACPEMIQSLIQGRYPDPKMLIKRLIRLYFNHLVKKK